MLPPKCKRYSLTGPYSYLRNGFTARTAPLLHDKLMTRKSIFSTVFKYLDALAPEPRAQPPLQASMRLNRQVLFIHDSRNCLPLLLE